MCVYMYVCISMGMCLCDSVCIQVHIHSLVSPVVLAALLYVQQDQPVKVNNTQLKYPPPLLVCSTLFFVSTHSMLSLWCSDLAWASSSPWLLHRCCSRTYCPLSSSQLSTAHLNYNTCGQHMFTVQYYSSGQYLLAWLVSHHHIIKSPSITTYRIL